MSETNSILPGSESRIFTKKISRGNFIKLMSVISGAVYYGCSDISMMLDIFPDRFKDNKELKDKILRSFVTAVIPGADEGDKNLVKIFTDDYYPFSKFCNLFANDLCSRSKKLFGVENFCDLTLKQRTFLIEDVLTNEYKKDLLRFYESAIFITQVSYYAGIYDDEKGCPLIYFKGRNTGFTPEEMYYNDNAKFLAAEITKDGNYY